MLVDGDFGAITDEQKVIVKEIVEKNEGLILLVRKLLNISTLEEGKYYYKKDLVDLEEIIKEIINYHQLEVGEKNIDIVFEKPQQNLPQLMADREMVKIAIQNIFDNALKYTPTDGTIKVFLTLDKKNVEIRIEDSGIGIPENQKDKLFGKFFRGANAAKVNNIGSGVGLFVAKSIIEAHNGKIWFESQEHMGTTFYISLPIK